MPTPKKPADHQEKQEAPYELVEVNVAPEGEEPVMAMARRTTVDVVVDADAPPKSITVTVLEDALDDFELLDDLRAVDDDNDASRFPSLIRRMVGDEYKTIMNEMRGKNGRVSVAVGMQFVWDLFRALGPKS